MGQARQRDGLSRAGLGSRSSLELDVGFLGHAPEDAAQIRGSASLIDLKRQAARGDGKTLQIANQRGLKGRGLQPRLGFRGDCRGIDSIPSARPADIEKATNYVKAALASLKTGKAPDPALTVPYGCDVKY